MDIMSAFCRIASTGSVRSNRSPMEIISSGKSSDGTTPLGGQLPETIRAMKNYVRHESIISIREIHIQLTWRTILHTRSNQLYVHTYIIIWKTGRESTLGNMVKCGLGSRWNPSVLLITNFAQKWAKYMSLTQSILWIRGTKWNIRQWISNAFKLEHFLSFRKRHAQL